MYCTQLPVESVRSSSTSWSDHDDPSRDKGKQRTSLMPTKQTVRSKMTHSNAASLLLSEQVIIPQSLSNCVKRRQGSEEKRDKVQYVNYVYECFCSVTKGIFIAPGLSTTFCNNYHSVVAIKGIMSRPLAKPSQSLGLSLTVIRWWVNFLFASWQDLFPSFPGT